MGCSYIWWGCVELCFVSAGERPRTRAVCGFALLVCSLDLSERSNRCAGRFVRACSRRRGPDEVVTYRVSVSGVAAVGRS
eukprot:4294824-Prymnesium_polylepis.1